MDLFFQPIDEIQQKREKAKARDLRQSLWWRQKLGRGICEYCGEKFPPQELTMDHKTPIVRGGKSIKRNLAVVCKSCNQDKKYLLFNEWQVRKEIKCCKK